MRESLIAFIKAVQARVLAEDNAEGTGQFRHQISVGSNNDMQLWFGYGYFSAEKVLLWTPKPEGGEISQELTVEEGVGAFLKYYGLE